MKDKIFNLIFPVVLILFIYLCLLFLKEFIGFERVVLLSFASITITLFELKNDIK